MLSEDELVLRTIQGILAPLKARPGDLEVGRTRLRVGTEARHVDLLSARYRDHLERQKLLRVVVKRLEGRSARETLIYERLVSAYAGQIAPKLFAIEQLNPDCVLLFIEAIRPVSAWPWREPSAISSVLTRLATFHAAVDRPDILVPDWDYERELCAMAEHTCTMLDACRRDPDLSPLARSFRQFSRLVDALPRMRRQLLDEPLFKVRAIHGDVHSGNALLRRYRGANCPVLVDWGRARLGSPLEDVSCWLESLRCWEEEARRLHDTFLAVYLSALGLERSLTPSIRAVYWTAGASNALSGALLQHLGMVMDQRMTPKKRQRAYRAAQHWLRIVHRAYAWAM